MSGPQTAVLEWIEQQRLRLDALPLALQIAGLRPSRKQWHQFFDRLSLWLGVIFLAAAVIFFFAYNWQAMGRFARFGMVELLILISLMMCWRLDLNRAAGKATLLLAALFTGALLALVGQTYQTGADTYELFLAWALCILPWVVLARFAALWLFWLVLVNLMLYLYYDTFGSLLGLVLDPERILWTTCAFNTAALVLWEYAAHAGVPWLQERWPPRILAVVSGSTTTVLMVWAILDSHTAKIATLLVYLLWMGSATFYYRYRRSDLFVLTGAVLSAVMVIAVGLSELILPMHESAPAFLFIGLVVLGLSSAGGLWLKQIAQEQRQ